MPQHSNDINGPFIYGDERSFDDFFRQYYARLCFFANSILKDDEDARDVVQDCFIKIWKNHITITKPEAIKSYLYNAVRNSCLNFLRHKKLAEKKTRELGQLVDETEGNWLDDVTRAEMIHEIMTAINSLPPRIQQVFRKSILEGKNYREIALELNTTASTIRTQKARALALLKQKMGKIASVLFFL